MCPQMAARRTYGGRTGEERRAERRARLLAAARELIRERGWAATSLRAVCARADLADRYFYESFADRDALLGALFDEAVTVAQAAVAGAVDAAPADPAAQARAAVATLVDVLAADPALARLTVFEDGGANPHWRAAVRRWVDFIADRDERLLGDAAPPRARLELTAHARIGALQAMLIATDQGEVDVTREELIDVASELAR